MALTRGSFSAVALTLAACSTTIDPKPLPYPCNPDAGPDPSGSGRFLPDGGARQCPSGMRCGLEGVCRPTDGGHYLCTDDSWCDPGWSCNFQGTCSSASDDPLVQVYGGSFTAAVVSPLFNSGLPSFVEASVPFETVLAGNQILAGQTMALGTPDGGVYEIDELNVGFMGLQGILAIQPKVALPIDAGSIRAAAALVQSTWFLTSDSPIGLLGMSLVDAGAGKQRGARVQFPFGPAGVTNPDDLRALGPATFVAFEKRDGGHLWPFIVPPVQGAPAAAFPLYVPPDIPTFAEAPDDLIGVTEGPCTGLLATSPAGVRHLAQTVLLDGGAGAYSTTLSPWSPAFSLPLEDGGAVVPRRMRIGPPSSLTGEQVLVAEVAVQGRSQLYVFQLAPTAACSAPAVAQAPLSLCSPCAPGEDVADFRPDSTGLLAIEVYCLADGGTGHAARIQNQIGPIGQACSAMTDPLGVTSFFDETRVVMGQHNPMAAAFAGSHGNLWTGPSLTQLAPFLVPDLPPDVASGTSDTFFLDFSKDGTYAGDLPGPDLSIFALDATGNFAMACEIEGPVHDLVLRIGLIQQHLEDAGSDISATGNVPIAQVDPTLDFKPPFHAVSFGVDGGRLAVALSTSDALLAADVTTVVVNPPPPMLAPLSVRVVPQPGTPIQSLAWVTPGAGEPDVALYVLTSNSLFQVVGNLADFSWRAVQVPLPGGAPMKLLSDGNAVRIAFQDGRVYSLRTGLLLAPPLPVLPPPFKEGARDFARFCGDTYALGDGAVYRLVPSATGGVSGTWTRFDVLTGAVPPGDGNLGLGKGRLRAPDPAEGPIPELELFTGFGTMTVAHPGAPCAR